MRGITKRFPGVVANEQVDFEALQGEIHALLGENGAGKSTLSNILTGLYRPDEGEILVNGQPVAFRSPRDAIAAGIGMVHQHFRLAASFTVAENLVLGHRDAADRGFLLEPSVIEGRVTELARRYRMPVDPGARVWQLSVGEQQRVEVLKTLYRGARILILDEPTSLLTPQESENLFETLRLMAAEGRTVIFISHKLEEVMAVSRRVTVLRRGKVIGTVPTTETNPRELARMMVGRDVSSFYKKDHDPQARRGPPVLAAVDIADGRRVKGCSLTVHAGEVVGLAGLVGAGRTELAHLIIGASPMTSGHLEMEGRAVTIRTPGEALDAGIAYLTEDRKALGLFLDMSCLDNINLAVLGRDAKLGYILDRDQARDRANRAFATLGIRAANVGVTAGGLSGGNQQKVLLSRLLAATPKVLILDEPTRGVDVGAKSEIYSIIDNSAKSGTAILVISSDLPEIIGICDRVIVMRAGRIVGEIAQGATSPLNQEDIMAFATGTEQLDAS